MKFRINTIDKRIVFISDLKKDIQVNIYNDDIYQPIITFYANKICKYPLEIDFSYDYSMPTSIRTETFKHNLRFDHEGDSTKFYKLCLK